MALARPSIPRIADALGVSRAAVENCLELAQKAGLIRTGSRGGGRGGVHLDPAELTTLAFGHGVEPRSALGHLIPAFRSLPPFDHPCWLTSPAMLPEARQLRGCCFREVSIQLDAFRDARESLPKRLVNMRWSGEGDPRCYRALPGATLGEAFDGLVDYLSYPEAARLRGALRRGSNLVLRMRSDLTAQISYTDEIDTGRAVFSTEYRAEDFRLAEPLGLTRTATFSLKVFEVLADLWADSRAHLGINSFPTPSGPASAEDGPDSESTEDAPAPPALSDRSSSLNPRQGTMDLLRQEQARGRIATGLPSRFDPILGDREGQARFPWVQGEGAGSGRNQTGAFSIPPTETPL